MQKLSILSVLLFVNVFFFLRPFQEDTFLYKQYYTLVTIAEGALIHDDIPKALEIYEQLFEEYEKVFAKDLYNASICAVRLEKNEFAVHLLKKLLSKGYEFNRLKYRRGLRMPKMYWDTLKVYAENIQFTTNDFYVDTINRLIEIDQTVRKIPNAYSVYVDSMRTVDYRVGTAFKNLIDTYGFPSEHLLGSSEVHHYTLGNIILHHASQRHRMDFIPMYDNAIKHGELDPYEYMYLVDLAHAPSTQFGTVAVHQLGTHWYKLKHTQAKLDSINIRRAQLGVEPLEQFIKKVLFQKSATSSPFIFKTIGGFGAHAVSNEAQFKEMQATFEEKGIRIK